MNALRRLHRYLAFNWLAVTLLFIAFNVAAGIAFHFVDKRRESRGDPIHSPEAVPSLSVKESKAVFGRARDIANRSMGQPWIAWSELPFHSANVNVDYAEPVPTRRTVAPRRPGKPRRTVWLFGGSTAFGFGVTDDQTVAAQLQRALNAAYPNLDVAVVNHAHLGHFSSQEVALMQWLLRAGQHADAVVFLDGFNDSRFAYDNPNNGPQATGAERAIQHAVFVSPNFPAARVGRYLGKFLRRRSQPAPAETATPSPEEQAQIAARRYAENVVIARASARPFGLAPLFVWQPTPYDYFDLERDPDFIRNRAVYPPDPVMKPLNAAVRATITSGDFLFLAPLLQGRRLRKTYVDSVHYGEEATRLLAETIARAMIERGTLSRN